MNNEKHKLVIENRFITELIPYGANSRTHSDEQVLQIAASIKEFGFTNPVLLDGDGGIIAGHGRIMAARKLGMFTVPSIVLHHLTDAQKRAYVIADNKLALNAGWDDDLLASEIQGLIDEEYDVDLIGFTQDELDELLSSVNEIGMPELSNEEPEFQQKAFTLHNDQMSFVDDAIKLAKTDPLVDTGINENSNGNALALVCEQWLKQKT